MALNLCMTYSQSLSWQDAHTFLINMQYQRLYQFLPYIKNTPEDKAIAEYIVFHSYVIQCLLVHPQRYEHKVKYYYENVQYYCEKLPESSPYKEYLIGEMDCEMAILYIQQKNYWSAIRKVRTGYQKLVDCVKKFPHFYEPYKTLGILHTAIGNIPQEYAWIVHALGLKGTIPQGEKELLLCIEKSNLQQVEAQLAYAYLCVNIFFKREKAFKIATQMPLNYPESPFIAAVCALICTKLNQDEAGAYIIENLKRLNQNAEYFQFAFTEYLMAEYALHQNNFEQAAMHYQSYIEKVQNNVFQADSYFKIGLCYELQGYRTDAVKYYQKCVLLTGIDQEEDKQAQKYAHQLLKRPLNSIERNLRIARNYTDGGYYEQAIRQIAFYEKILSYYSSFEQLEWYYRMARIYHAQKNWDKALLYYKKATQIRLSPTSWMEAFSWYYMGTIYELQKNTSDARACYQKALSYQNYEYRNSLERRTKAALQRVKE
ncbi:MAG: tetratricopeptide repeat protein [Bacteroidia bacterium]|nr:tetratricopeptide repeat protein [Bacteroidia bacterium]